MSSATGKPNHKSEAGLDDSWKSVDPYDNFMGRWSRLVAPAFIQWLSPPPGLKWLDVGCGSGALSEAALNHCAPAELTAIDQSDDFVRGVQERLGNLVHGRVGDAIALPVEDNSVDHTVSGLVLNFISDPIKALTEMKRVTTPDGTVAVYVWDYTGRMDFLNKFWDTVVKLDPKASTLHEGSRFPDSTATALTALFGKAGFVNIESTSLDIITHFLDFDDYWRPFLGGQGPAPTYLMSLEESDRQKLRKALFDCLPIQDDGSITMEARAWAVKGKLNQ
jgi:ubiquinone/menaquinone biosynthesis C-methylase UbiE